MGIKKSAHKYFIFSQIIFFWFNSNNNSQKKEENYLLKKYYLFFNGFKFLLYLSTKTARKIL